MIGTRSVAPASSLKRWLLPILFAGLTLFGAGCGSDNGSASTTTPQALIVGSASGSTYQAIQSRFRIVRGTGVEDPTPFQMIVFDGNNTTPAQLQANPGVMRFLQAGKAVVILNNTEAHRSGLSGAIWAHAQGASPAVAFFVHQDSNGTPQQLIEVDFPVRLRAVPGGDASSAPTIIIPASPELRLDSQAWLKILRQRLRGQLGSIAPATVGQGQTILSFDQVKPVTIEQVSVLNGQPAPFGTAWGPSGTHPPNFSTDFSATFETRLYAILEGNSPSTYQHKIIARQYLLVSPPSPLSTSLVTHQFAIRGSNWNGSWPVYSTLGFNTAFTLSVQLLDAPILGVTENKPESVNGVTTLTTSESHTETVGLSATFGIQNGNGVGTVGASWSDSWTWGQAESVQFQDWESNSNVDIANNFANYNFTAFSGSDVTAATVQKDLLQLPPNNDQINSQIAPPFFYFPPKSPGLPNFNQLQTSAMTNQSETEWATSSGQLVPPETVQLISSAAIFSGELLELTSGVRNIFKFAIPYSVFTGYDVANLYEVFDLNFAAPGLQPPSWDPANQQSVTAPWTVTFAQPSPDNGDWRADGLITLNSAQSSPTTINLSYVIQPRQPMLTTGSICPGNSTPFAPGPGVISNNPLSVTIPAGQTQASLAPLFEPEGQPYNVQVIAWQTSANVDGQQVINPQNASCITVPGQIPGG
jgi:hypothetical protein